MRFAHFDLYSGISGDMTLGALVDAGAPFAPLKKIVAAVPVKGYTLSARRVEKGAILATKVDVRVNAAPRHTKLSEIVALLKRARLPAGVRKGALEVFANLGRAEGRVHRGAVEFHEVGAVDAIVDVVGACAGLHLLGIDRVTCSAVPITHGTIRGAHGEIPIPGPATIQLLKGFRIVPRDLDRETVTPTGAAILATFADPKADFPEMTLEAVGVGAGDWDLDRPNVLRVLVGTAAAPEESDVVWEIDTNLDNASGELVGYLFETLFESGAVDVYTTPIQMKKSRPGVKVSVLVPPSRRAAVEAVLLRETPTFGVRRVLLERSKLERREIVVKTSFGPIRCKVGSMGGEPLKASPEFEDVRAAARAHGVPLSRVIDAVRRAASSSAARGRART